MGPRKGGAGMDYKSARWRRLRERVLRRDRYLCRENARYGRTVPATVVHHVWPAALYPEYAWCEWNLISLSAQAHNAMHDRETDALTELGESWRRRIPPHPPGGTLVPPGTGEGQLFPIERGRGTFFRREVKG